MSREQMNGVVISGGGNTIRRIKQAEEMAGTASLEWYLPLGSSRKQMLRAGSECKSSIWEEIPGNIFRRSEKGRESPAWVTGAPSRGELWEAVENVLFSYSV